MPGVNNEELIEINNENEELPEQKAKTEIIENDTITKTKQIKEKKKKFYKKDAESILEQLVNRERPKILQILPHSIIPGFNLSVAKCKLQNLSDYTLFRCSVPHCVYLSSEHPNKVDLCYKRTITHQDYMYSLNRQRAFYEIAEKKKDFKKSMKKGVYPYTVINYAELLENSPDPYFQARYDWYYTGGNIKCSSNNNLVCHSTGSNLNELVLSRLKKKSKAYDLKAFLTMDFLVADKFPNSEIFEIQSLALKNRFSIRQKYSLSLLTYDDKDLICDYILSSHETPLITSASDNLDLEIIATGNLNKEVFLWDVNNSTRTPKQTLFENDLDSVEKSKNWNCLCYFDKNIFAFTTLNEFGLLDARQSSNESKTNLCTFGKYKEMCENISSLAKSNYDNLIYFGTTHKLFTVDARFMGKDMKDKYIVQRWTHQMESTPLILKTYKWAEHYELIAMSSLLSGDIRICENFIKFKNNKYKNTSTCLPFVPPSLLDGYKTAKMNGECLDPVTNLEKRINCCTTGLDFMKKGDNLYLMISNSLGDVFSTKLNFDEEIKYSEFNDKEIIMKYNEKVKLKLEKNPLPLNLTDYAQLQGMSKVLRCKRLNNCIEKPDDNNSVVDDDIPTRPKRKAKWEKSVSELYAYKDVLASNLLKVWDVELTGEKDIVPVLDKNIKKQQDIVKVNEWLNQSNFINDSLPTEDLFENSNALSFNTIVHSTLTRPTQTEINQIRNTEILNNSSEIDNTLRDSIHKNIIPAVKEELENPFNGKKDSIHSYSDNEIPPAQIPVTTKCTSKTKKTEKPKRTFVKGF